MLFTCIIEGCAKANVTLFLQAKSRRSGRTCKTTGARKDVVMDEQLRRVADAVTKFVSWNLFHAFGFTKGSLSKCHFSATATTLEVQDYHWATAKQLQEMEDNHRFPLGCFPCPKVWEVLKLPGQERINQLQSLLTEASKHWPMKTRKNRKNTIFPLCFGKFCSSPFETVYADALPTGGMLSKLKVSVALCWGMLRNVGGANHGYVRLFEERSAHAVELAHQADLVQQAPEW